MRNRKRVTFYTSGTFGNSSCMNNFAYNRLTLCTFPYNPPVLLLYKLLETFIKEWEEARVTVHAKLISPPWSTEILCCECLHSPNSFVGEAVILLGSFLRKLKTDTERNEDGNGFHSPTYNTASHFIPAFPKTLCAPWYHSDVWIVLPAVSAPHTTREDVAAPPSLWLWHFAKTVLCLYHRLWYGTPR